MSDGCTLCNGSGFVAVIEGGTYGPSKPPLMKLKCNCDGTITTQDWPGTIRFVQNAEGVASRNEVIDECLHTIRGMYGVGALDRDLIEVTKITQALRALKGRGVSATRAITLDDVIAWADGVHAAQSTEHAPTQEEARYAALIIAEQLAPQR